MMWQISLGGGVTAPPGEEVAHQYQFDRPGPVGVLVGGGAGDQFGQGVGGVGLKAGAGIAPGPGGPPAAHGGRFELSHQGQTALRGQGERAADHAVAVLVVAELPQLELAATQGDRIDMGLAVLAGVVSKLGEIRVPSHR